MQCCSYAAFAVLLLAMLLLAELLLAELLLAELHLAELLLAGCFTGLLLLYFCICTYNKTHGRRKCIIVVETVCHNIPTYNRIIQPVFLS